MECEALNTEQRHKEAPGLSGTTSGLIKILLVCLVFICLNKPYKEVVFQPAVMGNRQPVGDYREPKR